MLDRVSSTAVREANEPSTTPELMMRALHQSRDNTCLDRLYVQAESQCVSEPPLAFSMTRARLASAWAGGKFSQTRFPDNSNFGAALL